MDIMMTNGDGGPFMSGTWYNPNTGDSFTVRDTFFEDNNLIVMTTDGRRLNYDIVSRYIKSDKPIQKQPQLQQQPMQQIQQNNTTNTPKDIQDMLDEDPGLKIGQISDPIQQYPQSVAVTGIHEDSKGIIHEVEDEDDLLVRRIMKRATKPEIKCGIVWNNFPSKQLEMLEMMGVDENKIAEFVIKSFDLNTIQEQIKKSIIDYINKPATLEDNSHKFHETQNTTIITATNTTITKDPLEVLNTKMQPKKKTTKKK